MLSVRWWIWDLSMVLLLIFTDKSMTVSIWQSERQGMHPPTSNQFSQTKWDDQNWNWLLDICKLWLQFGFHTQNPSLGSLGLMFINTPRPLQLWNWMINSLKEEKKSRIVKSQSNLFFHYFVIGFLGINLSLSWNRFGLYDSHIKKQLKWFNMETVLIYHYIITFIFKVGAIDCEPSWDYLRPLSRVRPFLLQWELACSIRAL